MRADYLSDYAGPAANTPHQTPFETIEFIF